jgi:hypothetical protein
MSVTSGQFSLPLSEHADPPSSSESKSHPQTWSAPPLTRTCRDCGASKPSAEFQRGSKDRWYRRCRTCHQAAKDADRITLPRHTKANKKWRSKNRGWGLISGARARAKERGLPFEITFHEIQARVAAGRCEATGIPFGLAAPARAWNAPSLDQIKPGAGYTRENTRVVLYAFNVMANVWGERRIMEVARALGEKMQGRSNDLSAKLAEQLKKHLPCGSTLYDMTWKEVVTPSGHRYWRLAALGRRTSGSEYTGWPTPVAKDDGKTPEGHLAMKRRMGERDGSFANRTAITSLAVAALTAGWPTPTGTDAERRGKTTARSDALHLNAAAQMATGWATPATRDYRTPNHVALKDRGGGAKGEQLNNQVAHVIPGASLNGLTASTESAGLLNVEFSRWLQGIPATWLSCAPSATRSTRSSRRNSSKPTSSATDDDT